MNKLLCYLNDLFNSFKANQEGSAIIMALMTVLIVGSLGAIAFSASISSQERNNSNKNQSKAELAAEAGIQLAIRKIQRVGSSNSDERTCSLLDGPRWKQNDTTANPNNYGLNYDCQAELTPPANNSAKGYLNGINAQDGSYNFIIRGGGVDDSSTSDVNELFTRQITAYGYHEGEVAKKTLNFTIIPRSFKYALYANGNNSSPAVKVGNNARLYIPPAYKSSNKSRGGDLGANNDVEFDNGSYVNNRTADSLFYDYLFRPNTQSSSDEISDFYNGRPWGTLHQSLQPDSSAYDVKYDNNTVLGTNPNFPTPTPTSNGENSAILFNGNVKKLANNTALPIYTNILSDFKSIAENNTVDDEEGAVYTATEFQNMLNSSQNLSGLIYVDNNNGEIACTLTVSHTLNIENGGLIIRGCDLEVNSDASLDISHQLSDIDHESNQYPALMVLRNTRDFGGNFTSRASNEFNVSLQGLTYIEDNFNLQGTNMASGGNSNFISSGSMNVGGKFNFQPSGNIRAVIKWNPIVQKSTFDGTSGRMGTYSIKTDDTFPANTPYVKILDSSKPANPSSSKEARFQLEASDIDSLKCKLEKEENNVKIIVSNWTNCASLKADYDNLTQDSVYTFILRGCNTNSCAEDIYTWAIDETDPPTNITKPTISGFTTIGETLSVNNGTWDNNPTSYTYQWQRCAEFYLEGDGCVDIDNATNQTLTLTDSQYQSQIRVKVTAINSAGNNTSISDKTNSVLYSYETTVKNDLGNTGAYWRLGDESSSNTNPDEIGLTIDEIHDWQAELHGGLSGAWGHSPAIRGTQNTSLYLKENAYLTPRPTNQEISNLFDTGVTRNFSIEMWIKPLTLNASSGWQTIFSKGYFDPANNSYEQYALYLNNVGFLHLIGTTNQNSREYFNSNSVIELNKWHHIVLTYQDSIKKFKLYLNGTLLDMHNGDGPVIPILSNPIQANRSFMPQIGRGLAVDGARHPFTGYIDEFAFYDKLLSISKPPEHYEVGKLEE